MDLTELARLATPGSSTSDGGVVGRPSCEITLFVSPRDGVVALVDGDNWRWAHTTLDTAGFEKSGDGNRAIPLTDLDRTREVLPLSMSSPGSPRPRSHRAAKPISATSHAT